MNKARRTKLRTAIDHLNLAHTIISDAKYDEQEGLDNLPENLQNSERYEAMENAVDNLDDAVSSIEDAKRSIDEAIA